MGEQQPPARILVADDDPGTILVYRHTLQPNAGAIPATGNFEVTCCTQGPDAIAAVRAAVAEDRPFAVAFLDIIMPPGPDGVHTAEEIRKLDQHINIVIVTCHTETDPGEIARRVPPASHLLYLHKPLHFREIRHVAVALVAKQKAERQLADALGVLESRAAQRLRLLSTAVEQTSDGIAVVDPRGHLLFVNQTCAAMHSYTQQELVGQHLAIFHAAEEMAAVAEAKDQLETEGGFAGEVRHQRRDGTIFPVRKQYSPLRDEDDQVIGFITTMRDISERKEAQGALQVSEERYRRIFENAQVGLFSTRVSDGLTTAANDRMAQILGYAAGDEIIDSLRVSEIYVDPRRREILLGELAARGEARNFEAELRRADGGTVWVRVSCRLDEKREVMEGLATDISEEKRAGARIKKMTQELEKRVAERTHDLHQRTAQLKAVNEELESFTYSVSHDLRAPLRAIDGFSHALVEDYSDRLDPEGLDYLQRIRAGAQRMSQLIEDLMNLSKVASKGIDAGAIDFSGLAREVTQELRHGEPARQVDFTIATGLEVRGDRRLLRIMLENLIGNAWKYTSKKEQAKIVIGARLATPEEPDDGTGEVFFVRDNGAGFDMEHAGNLFGAFQRMHSADEFPGSGIGLATAKRVINKHRGNIWAEAEVGRGATFYFTLGC